MRKYTAFVCLMRVCVCYCLFVVVRFVFVAFICCCLLVGGGGGAALSGLNYIYGTPF